MKCVRFFLEHLTERVVILPTWLHGSIVDVCQTAVIFINNYFTPGQVKFVISRKISCTQFYRHLR